MTFQMANTCCFLYYKNLKKKNHMKNTGQPNPQPDWPDPTRPARFPCLFFMFLKRMSNFMSIICYLLLIHKFIFLCIILGYKNLKFKDLIDDIAINLWFSWNFVNMEDIKRKCIYLWICQKSRTIKKNIE